MPEPLDVLEARIRADVTTLDRRLMAEQRARRPVTTSVDWAGVRRLLGVPRVNTPEEHPGMAARVRAAGVPNLADLVRDVLRNRGQLASYRIKQEVHRRALELGANAALGVSGEQVDSCLARLARRGEVERMGHGLYRATDSLKGTSHQ